MQIADIVGKTIVLTGKFSEVTRAEAEAALARLGAKIGGDVSKKTDILFVGDKAGSKLAKARSLGIVIADEPTLVALLAGASAPDEPASMPEPEPAKSSEAPASSGQAPVAAFAGKTLVLTGTFKTMKRAEAETILRDAGAKIASSVTKKTDLLVHGDDAGSKLDKALALGIPQMTELELVALLTASGQAAPKLAGALDELAQQSVATSEIATVVAELRAFVGLLQRRKDIQVTTARLGRKAGKAKLAQLEAAKIPRPLIDLYAEIDGIHVEWRFIEPQGDGSMRIPEVSQWTRFRSDDDTYMGFGDDREALLFDEITAEGGTWLVRKQGAGADEFEIIFASAAEGSDGVTAASSIVEYLRSAMASGFVPYWPRCFRTNPYVSYATQEAAVTRFRAAAVVPTPIRVGDRVQFSYFAEGGRGRVRVAEFEASPSSLAEFAGSKFAQIELDEGSLAWIPHRWLKVWSKVDAYERLRDPGFDFAAAAKADLAALFDELVRAIDPLSHYASGLPSNARRAAGMLATRSLVDALAIVVALDKVARGAELAESRTLSATGDEFDAAELSRHRWSYTREGVLIGLFGGLLLLAQHESARRGIPGTELVDVARAAALSRNPRASALHRACTTTTPLDAPPWGFEHAKNTAELGLPADAVVLIGTGF